jgi:hypothetical protein
MRFVAITSLILFGTTLRAADDSVLASRTVDGKTNYVTKEGTKGGTAFALEFLGSCSYGENVAASGKEYTRDDFNKSRTGDHSHLELGEARTVRVMNEPVEVSELVVAAGSIWVRSGDKVQRFAKYDHMKALAYETWLDKAPKTRTSPKLTN